MAQRSIWERAIPSGVRAYRRISVSLKLSGDLQRLLEDARLRIAAVRLDAPELDIVPPPPGPEPGAPAQGPVSEPGTAEPLPPRPVGAKAPARRWRRAELLAAAVAAACAAAAALSYRGAGLPALTRSTPVPMAAAVGLALQGGLLHTVDSSRQLLVSLALDGRIAGIVRLEEPGACGLAADSGGFWTSSAGGRISFRSAEPGLPVRRVYANPGRSPRAMAFDGLLLWVSDPVVESVYQYAPRTDLNALRELPLLGLKPAALHREGELLWVLDGPTRVLRRYKIGPLPSPVDEVSLGGYFDAQAQFAGMAVGGESLWILTQSPAVLRRFALRRLRWVPAAKPFAI